MKQQNMSPLSIIKILMVCRCVLAFRAEAPFMSSYFDPTTSTTNETHRSGKDSSNKPSLTSVITDIFQNYKRFARPVKSATTVTVVNVTFNLLCINSVNEKQQTLTQTFFMDLSWFDENLAWNSSEYGGLNHVIVPQEKVWLPDLTVMPFALGMTKLGYDELPVRVESSGKVWWQPSGLFTTQCQMDITYYPFDKQFCELMLLTWTSRREDVILHIEDPPDYVVLGYNYERNSAWQLLSVKAFKADIMTYGGFSRVKLIFTLRRRPTFAMLVLALPNILLAFISTFVFLLPAQSGEKISLSITVFLSFVLSLSILLDQLPPSSLQLSFLITFLAALACCSALSLLLSIFVMRLYDNGAEAVGTGNAAAAKFVGCVRLYQNGKWWKALKRAFAPCTNVGSRNSRPRAGKADSRNNKDSAEASRFSPLASSTSSTTERKERVTSFSPASGDVKAFLNKPREGEGRGPPGQLFRGWSHESESNRPSLDGRGYQAFVRWDSMGEEGMGGDGVKREEEEEGGGGRATTWGDVAVCLDYVLFRCFISAVIASIIVSAFCIVRQYSDENGGMEWGRVLRV